MTSFGFLGFGEAGQAMAASLKAQDPSLIIAAYDKAPTSVMASVIASIMASTKGRLCDSPSDLAATCDIIISVVTADEAVNAAQSIASYLGKAHHFLDGNSVSPGTKRQAADIIQEAGACYCDMAIMAPINPRGHKTPVLLAGANEAEITPIFDALAFSYGWEGTDIGQASVVKMLRSILIKGMECIISESVIASQGLGLDERILSSAGKTLGIADMPALADYVMERAATHGRRRAAEMREVAKTLDELGLSSDMSEAIARMQDRLADMAIGDHFEDGIPQDRAQLAPLMRAAQNSK